MMRKLLSLVAFLLLIFNMSGCNKDINISPHVTVNGEDVSTIYHVGAGELDEDKYAAPRFTEHIEVMEVKPGSLVEVMYIDVPKRVYIHAWLNDELKVKEELKDVSSSLQFSAPMQEGTYIYRIASRWNFRTASNTVFVLEVKNN
ncbi:MULTISPECIES: hypothetical protein [Bacillus]|uniref:hypothetical protein n=1 Tax=Bacillus TaxID=1386 RepID=UPI000BB8D49B|nr:MULTISPECIES: hypothetical protein [Bacillus]